MEGKAGRMVAIFFGYPNRDSLNSVDLFLMDPRYEDDRLVVVEIKSNMEFGNGSQWVNNSHHVDYETVWRERKQDEGKAVAMQAVARQCRPRWCWRDWRAETTRTCRSQST